MIVFYDGCRDVGFVRRWSGLGFGTYTWKNPQGLHQYLCSYDGKTTWVQTVLSGGWTRRPDTPGFFYANPFLKKNLKIWKRIFLLKWVKSFFSKKHPLLGFTNFSRLESFLIVFVAKTTYLRWKRQFQEKLFFDNRSTTNSPTLTILKKKLQLFSGKKPNFECFE